MTKMAKIEKASGHEADGEQGVGRVDDITATRLVDGPAQGEVVRGQERRGREEGEHTHPHPEREREGGRKGEEERGSGADWTLSFCNF